MRSNSERRCTFFMERTKTFIKVATSVKRDKFSDYIFDFGCIENSFNYRTRNHIIIRFKYSTNKLP